MGKGFPIHIFRRSKFNNVPQTVDGLRFDSKKEAARYIELKLLERIGQVRDLVADKKVLRFPLDVNGVHICIYEADFAYFDEVTKASVVEDAKGVRTPEYKIKKKLMKAIYEIEIRET